MAQNQLRIGLVWDILVFAAYNDAVPYAQLVEVMEGRVVREFLQDDQDPMQNVNEGRLGFEDIYPIQSWVEAASFIDGDDLAATPDDGMLWIFCTLDISHFGLTEALSPTLLPLCGFAFLAGFMDSMVGGGGLIQLPALFVLLPGVAAPTILGTNKLVALTGTAVAASQYARHVKIDWPIVLPAAGAAFVCSGLGAHFVSGIQAGTLRPLILALLVLVAVYVFARKDFGTSHAPRLTKNQQRLYGMGAGSVIGLYDGFFGPGTGSFLIFTFIGLFGLSFLAASASSKVINAATNLAAVLLFGLTGHLLYALALPMAVCNIGGSVLGTRLAVAKGSRFVRVLFLVVLSAIIAKFAWDTFHHQGNRQ